MLRPITTLLLLGLGAVALAAPLPELRFDQGIDVKAVMREAGLERQAAAAKGFPRHLYWIQGCEDKTLPPGVNETAKFRLSSTEVVEDCDYGFPGGGCRTTFGWTRTLPDVRLVLKGRPAGNPAETFTVCLTGNDLGVLIMQTPTRYGVSVSGSDVVLTAKP
jgi:hypothetical protein